MRTKRLKESVAAFAEIVEAKTPETELLVKGRDILNRLVAHDDWLPEFVAEADAERYRQYLLYCDPLERFSMVSFVWGAGQRTPIHDHTVWGLIGILRGKEQSRQFHRLDNGRLEADEWKSMVPGDIDVVSPNQCDIHQVANALLDRPSISIHVYGANIGAVSRNTFDPETWTPKCFISGYSNDVIPNLWNRAG